MTDQDLDQIELPSVTYRAVCVVDVNLTDIDDCSLDDESLLDVAMKTITFFRLDIKRSELSISTMTERNVTLSDAQRDAATASLAVAS